MKKSKYYLSILLILLLCIGCCACQKKEEHQGDVSAEAPTTTDTQDETKETEETQPDVKADPEKAMENFVAKLEAGDYVTVVKGRSRINVCDTTEIDWYYASEDKESKTCFTLNGETFTAYLGEEGLEDLCYSTPKSALDISRSKLLNYWVDLADGNMFDLFYNNVDDPLEFTSKDTEVKYSILSLMSYSDMALRFMHDVVVRLDAEDPETVTITAVIDDDVIGRRYYDDAEITVYFGAAEPDPLVAAWKSDPAFPLDPTGWERDNETAIGAMYVTVTDSGEEPLPFPAFASYTLTYDQEIFDRYNKLVFTDTHASESDVQSYIAQLEEAGFKPKEDGQGYRKPIRAAYHAYSDVNAWYDNGLVLEANLEHDYLNYTGVAEINEAIAEFGFPGLSEADDMEDWIARDEAWGRSESWAYLFNYDIYLIARVWYEDEDALIKYIGEYGKKLEEAGFKAADGTSHSDEEEDEEEAMAPTRYRDANQSRCFWYATNGAGMAQLVFSQQHCLTAEDVAKRTREAGFPEVNVSDVYFVKDVQPYYHIIAGFEGLYLRMVFFFDSVDEANAYLVDYSDKLEAQGFEAIDSRSIGMNKDVCYVNKETLSIFGFDLFEDADGSASVYADMIG